MNSPQGTPLPALRVCGLYQTMESPLRAQTTIEDQLLWQMQGSTLGGTVESQREERENENICNILKFRTKVDIGTQTGLCLSCLWLSWL